MTTPSASPNITSTDIEKDIQYIKMIADTVALNIASTMQWSTYHNWKMISSLTANSTAAQVAEYQAIWQYPQRYGMYGTCVDFAYLSARDLRTALSSIPSLAHHAENVKLFASRETDKITGNLSKPEHVIAVLQVRTSIILLDLSFSPMSILLRTGEKREIVSFVTFNNDLNNVVYSWFSLKRPPYRGSLIYKSGSVKSGPKAYRMSEISWEDAIIQVSFDMARETRSYTGHKFPDSKYMVSDQFLDEKPEAPSLETPFGFYTAMCKIGFHFHTKIISVMFPVADWLEKQENSGYRRHLGELGVRWTKLQASTGCLGVKASGSRVDKERIDLVAEIVEQLDIDRTEFLEAVERVSKLDVRLLKSTRG
jgi:hypothetical protein